MGCVKAACLYNVALPDRLSSARVSVEMQNRITPQDQAECVQGSIQDWGMEEHRMAQRIAYRYLGDENPAPTTPAFEHHS
jgi:hypothetical protein